MQFISLIDELKFLDSKRANIARLLNSEREATKNIPNEILLEIFSLLCPPGAGSMGSRNSRPSETKDHPTADLRRITQVSSMWRSVALASPRLWATSLKLNDEALPW